MTLQPYSEKNFYTNMYDASRLQVLLYTQGRNEVNDTSPVLNPNLLQYLHHFIRHKFIASPPVAPGMPLNDFWLTDKGREEIILLKKTGVGCEKFK